MIRSSRPPATTIPIPNGTYSYSFASTVVELLWWTWLPAIRTSRCGANGSESSVLGTIPARFSRHSLFTIARFPPALVPEYPSALCSASTSVITASQGLHAPMENPASGEPLAYE